MLDDRFPQFDVQPFTGSLGAAIVGVDMRTADEATFASVVRALHEYHVLAHRPQGRWPLCHEGSRDQPLGRARFTVHGSRSTMGSQEPSPVTSRL